MFQLQEMTEVHVTSVTNRTELHGDERMPAVSIAVEIEAANTLLDIIDPKIREALYKAVEDQDNLPGIEQSTPVLRCNSFERHTLPTSHEGWTLSVDDGIDDTDPMTFGGVKVDKFSVEAKQGGTIVLRFRMGTSDVDADKLGKLAMHNGQSIWITLIAPKPGAEAIDGTVGHPGAAPSAGDLFAEEHDSGLGVEPDEDAGPELEDRLANAYAEADTDLSPELEERVQVAIEQSQPGTRTARGREKTKAALEAGVKAAHGTH